MNINFTAQEEAWFRLQGNTTPFAELAKEILKLNNNEEVATQISSIFRLSMEERQAKIDAHAAAKHISQNEAIESIKGDWSRSLRKRKREGDSPLHQLFAFAVQAKHVHPDQAGNLFRLVANDPFPLGGLADDVKPEIEHLNFRHALRQIDANPDQPWEHLVEGQDRMARFALEQYAIARLQEYSNTDNAIRCCHYIRESSDNQELVDAAAILEVDIQLSRGRSAEARTICEQLIQTAVVGSVPYVRAQFVLANESERGSLARRIINDPSSRLESRYYAWLYGADSLENSRERIQYLIQQENIPIKVKNAAKYFIAQTLFKADLLEATRLFFEICQTQKIDQKSFRLTWNLLCCHREILEMHVSSLPRTPWSQLFQIMELGTDEEKEVVIQDLSQNSQMGEDVRAVLEYARNKSVSKTEAERMLQNPHMPLLFSGLIRARYRIGDLDSIPRDLKWCPTYRVRSLLFHSSFLDFANPQASEWLISVYRDQEIAHKERDQALLLYVDFLVNAQRRPEAVETLRKYLERVNFEIYPKIQIRCKYANLFAVDDWRGAIQYLTVIGHSHPFEEQVNNEIKEIRKAYGPGDLDRKGEVGPLR